MFPAEFSHLGPAFFLILFPAFKGYVIEIFPDLQIGEEVGRGHLEFCMGLIRRRFGFSGPHTRILYSQGTGNNDCFLEAVMIPCFNDHS